MSKYNNFSALPFYGLQDGTYESWDCNKWYAWGQLYPLTVPRRLIPFFFKTGDSLVDAKIYKLCEKSGNDISISDFEEVISPTSSGGFILRSGRPEPTIDLNKYVGEYFKSGEFLVWKNNQNIKWARRTIGNHNCYALFDYSSGSPVSVIEGQPNYVYIFLQEDYSQPIGSKLVGATPLDSFSPSDTIGYFEESSSPVSSWLDVFKANGLVEKDGFVTFSTGVGFFDDGYYYIKFTTSKNEAYYSEIFKVEKNMGENHLALEWRNYPGDAGEMDLIPYKNSYVNKIFVESTLGMPSYEYEEEGEKRSGYFYPTRQLSYKKYKFTFIAPEYLCDVLRLVPMSDEIKITDSMGIILEPTDFNIDFNWLDGGHYAKVDCEFTTDTVVKKIGGMQLYKGRDFNLDWGKDFNSLSLDK